MKKNILFLIESLSGGGAEKVLTTLLQHIDKAKFNITLCCIVNQGVYLKDLPDSIAYTYLLDSPEHLSGFKRILYKIKYQLIYKLLPLSWVYQWFLPHHADVEVAFVEGFATKLLSHSTNKKAKKIAWVHIDLKYYPWTINNKIYKDINEERKTYLNYQKIVCVSQTVQDSFNDVYSCSNLTTVIYNPLDRNDIYQKAQHTINVNHRNIQFISVGRLTPQKGYDRLLPIIKRLAEEGFNFHLKIIGEGPNKAILQEYIDTNQLQEHVALLGFLKNPYPEIYSSDLFICSSRSEGYSLVIAESLILGIPVISTYCSGPNELLEEGKFGLLVDNTDESLYNGIKRLLSNDKLLSHYKQKAKERSKFFELETSIKKIENLLS